VSLVAGAGRVHDAVVIGAGLAGLAAAGRLAEAGADVVVVAKGVGQINLAPMTIDVLGYAPDRVERPREALGALVADRPDHPYALVPADAVAAALDWFKGRFDGARVPGYGYTGDLEENLLLSTPVGVPRPSALAPHSMAAGDLRSGGALLIVSFRSLRDFHPHYLADNLRRTGLGAESVELDLRPEDRVEANALGLARAFDDPGFRGRVVDAIASRLGGAERVGFPAALGLEDPHGVCADLEARLGRPVFEIPTLPPSAPGHRVHRVLRERLQRDRARIIVNTPATGFDRADGRVDAVRVLSAGRERSYRARHVVLATGGFAAGGHVLDSRWQARETALGLPLHGVPEGDAPRFDPEYFASHPLARAGVAADDRLRPVDAAGDPVYDNVRVVGATLAGAEPWKEKSGTGLSLATGHRAAELILEEGT
jgi:glycerol-3-phosphate dehydrogenase subunit B